VLDEGGASLSGYAYTAYFYNDYKGQPLSFNERGKVWKQYLTTSQITRATAVNAIDGFLDIMRPLMYVGKWKMDAEEAFSPGRLWTYGAGRVITDMEANLSQVENRAPDNPLVTHYYNQMTRFPAKFVLDILPDVMPEEVQRFFGPRAAIADLVRKAYHIT
jgi:hypothetical protein